MVRKYWLLRVIKIDVGSSGGLDVVTWKSFSATDAIVGMAMGAQLVTATKVFMLLRCACKAGTEYNIS